ncbi:phosphatase PAP2 family protein [Streptomyces fumigatiscleroticus]|nr:phosphatase PAP2 family protein [Streptomyces fumigatiscleroticus]
MASMTTPAVPLAEAGPEYGVGVYRQITDWAATTPGWMQTLGEIGTDFGVVVFAVLLLLQWWRARRREDRSMALALLAPVAVAGVYALSEAVKSWLHEERPCRAVPDVRTIAVCPAPGDWAFPSNHSVIAAASAATLLLTWRVVAAFALPLAVLVALSRVYVGVHYLHDVAAGALLGVVLAPVILLTLMVPGTRAVTRLRRHRALIFVLGTAPRPAPRPAPAAPDPRHATASHP